MEREDRDGGLAKAGAVTTGGSRPSNRAPSRAAGRDSQALGMDLGADMVRDQTHNQPIM